MAGMSPVRQDVTVVGRRLEPEDHRLRDFLTRVDQAYAWVEAGTPEADALLAAHGFTADDLPLVLAPDGVVSAATVERVADAWHESDPPQRTHYDLAIVGAGPAGLAAAVYAASDGLSTLLVERDVPGGQASHTSKIENFFGFPGGIEGAHLARLAGRQAEGFGAELVLLRGVTGSRMTPEGTQLDIAGGYQVTADVVIAAPGMDWRHARRRRDRGRARPRHLLRRRAQRGGALRRRPGGRRRRGQLGRPGGHEPRGRGRARDDARARRPRSRSRCRPTSSSASTRTR